MHPPLYIVLVGPLHSLSQSFSYASAHTHICASAYTHICVLKIYLHSLMYNSRLTAQLGVTLPIFCPPLTTPHMMNVLTPMPNISEFQCLFSIYKLIAQCSTLLLSLFSLLITRSLLYTYRIRYYNRCYPPVLFINGLTQTTDIYTLTRYTVSPLSSTFPVMHQYLIHQLMPHTNRIFSHIWYSNTDSTFETSLSPQQSNY